MALLASLIIGIATGIISSLLATNITLKWKERRLVSQFRDLEGTFDHLLPDQTKVEGATTEITYKGNGIFLLEAKTEYDDWDGRIIMNQPDYGEGTFKYKNKTEGGRLKIMVRDRNTIFAFPETLTHKNQKTDFYIFRRRVVVTSNQVADERASLSLPNPA